MRLFFILKATRKKITKSVIKKLDLRYCLNLFYNETNTVKYFIINNQ